MIVHLFAWHGLGRSTSVVSFGYDAAGRENARTTTGTGSVTRADYGWSRNAAGAIVSEDSSISGDPTNGTSVFAYDALGRLASADPPTTATLAYGWDAVPNRTSVQTGAGTPVTYSYDAANRLSSDSVSNTYTYDADGRLTVRPGDGTRPDEDLVFDDTGRLTRVDDASTSATLATYTCSTGRARARTSASAAATPTTTAG